jgi:hypothetical protein
MNKTDNTYKTVSENFKNKSKIVKHLSYTCLVCDTGVKLCESLPDRKLLEPLHMDCAVNKWQTTAATR